MNKFLIAGVIAVSSCSYLLWQYFTPVEIVAVHDEDTILVKHFPYFKSRQIAWWKANKDMIKTKYGIPYKSENDYYSVHIMDFGNGYRVDSGTDQDSDLLCFNEMVVDARCIEKKPRLWIRFSKNTGFIYR
ncbi:DUF943 family protein [Nissabacter sp. SGAir0207]|uniref:DUF943 family protein n=1 Tax=Nissabacter sp. SGAir0207 TaxID=2126321 RepID=UPI0010CCEF07|nr:DUF943 family protein [Nissabacter sp. SGAir0207]QCR38398.1 hypothetical protein C1N62_19855 [Nissabacter sp. SGAir0207]